MPDEPVVESILVEEPVPVTEPSRLLSDEDAALYAARLLAVGYTFSEAGVPAAYGFDVTDGTHTYNYRYDGSAGTAVELMDRVCAELGA